MFVSSWRSSRVRLSSSVWTYTAAYNIIFLSPSSIGSLSLSFSLVFYHFIYLFQSGTKESWRHVDARPGKKNSPPLVARPRRRREKRLAVSYFIPIDHPNRAVPIRARPACEISEDSLSLFLFALIFSPSSSSCSFNPVELDQPRGLGRRNRALRCWRTWTAPLYCLFWSRRIG